MYISDGAHPDPKDAQEVCVNVQSRGKLEGILDNSNLHDIMLTQARRHLFLISGPGDVLMEM